MKWKVLIISGMALGVAALVYLLVRLQIQYLRPKVVEVEKEVVREILGQVSPQEVEKALDSVRVYARVVGEEIEVPSLFRRGKGTPERAFRPIFIKGINLGAALPGSYPAEFTPSHEDYLRWFRLMGKAGFNAVRIYTVFPPEFYSALAEYNLKNRRHPLYLIQGIWVPVPDDEDYLAPDFVRQIKAEIEKAVDAVHGTRNYFVDVSEITLGFLFGREWEPDGVQTTQHRHPDHTSYQGHLISLPEGTPMEAWLAEMLDYIQTYEVVRYHGLHPVSFVNWLPLDPLYHDSEFIESPKVREYDNDLFTVDPSRFRRTPWNAAGFFASYHVYPYYPDFINLEYGDSVSRFGRDNFAGYLRALRNVTDGLPLVVAEFGVPSSRGIAHFNPLGLHQGGHTERQQGHLDAQLFQDLFDEGYAGGILFAWMDEWFKRNWLVMDFENPMHRNPLWHNIYDPEQTYGLVSFDPQVVQIDGDPADWQRVKPWVRTSGLPIRGLWVTQDPVYFYLRIDFAEAFDPSRDTLVLLLDTYRKDLGARKDPVRHLPLENGVEFAVVLAESGKVWVTESYQIFRDWIQDIRSEMRPLAEGADSFVEPALLANRARVTLAGDTIPEHRFYPGRLIYGRQQENSLADWYVQGQTLELRLGWNVLNVTDPSSLKVLFDQPETPDLDATETDGFAFSILWIRKGEVFRWPDPKAEVLKFTPRYRWEPWDQPLYKEHLKESYSILARFLPRLERDSTYRKRRIRANPQDQITVNLLPFPWPYVGAVTFSFDDGDWTQFQYAKPILEKYGARATFGIVASWVGQTPQRKGPTDEIQTLRMSREQILALDRSGHEIASHGYFHDPWIYQLPVDSLVTLWTLGKKALEDLLGHDVPTLHVPYSRERPQVIRAAMEAGFRYLRFHGERVNRIESLDPTRLHSFAVLSEGRPGIRAFLEWLDQSRGAWGIFVYHHLFPRDAKELQLMQKHEVENTYSVYPITFERHVRAARNRRLWIERLSTVADYLLAYRQAKLSVRREGDLLLVRLVGASRPLCVALEGPAGFYRIRGALQDGAYELRLFPLVFWVQPNETVVIERIPALTGGRSVTP